MGFPQYWSPEMVAWLDEIYEEVQQMEIEDHARDFIQADFDGDAPRDPERLRPGPITLPIDDAWLALWRAGHPQEVRQLDADTQEMLAALDAAILAEEATNTALGIPPGAKVEDYPDPEPVPQSDDVEDDAYWAEFADDPPPTDEEVARLTEAAKFWQRPDVIAMNERRDRYQMATALRWRYTHMSGHDTSAC
jgi:hypothetical protein